MSNIEAVTQKCPGCQKVIDGFLLDGERLVCPNCVHPAVFERWKGEWDAGEPQRQKEAKRKQREQEALEKKAREEEEAARELEVKIAARKAEREARKAQDLTPMPQVQEADMAEGSIVIRRTMNILAGLVGLLLVVVIALWFPLSSHSKEIDELHKQLDELRKQNENARQLIADLAKSDDNLRHETAKAFTTVEKSIDDLRIETVKALEAIRK